MEDDMENNSFTPIWENGAESPILLENVVGQGSTKYKIKLKYGGYFRLAKNSYKKRYCFGFQKCLNIDTCIYDFDDLNEEVATHYPPDPELSFSIFHIDKYATKQKFVKVDSNDNFKLMLSMYEVEKEVTIYVTMINNVETSSVRERESDDAHDEEDEEDESVTFSTNDEVGHASSKPVTVSSKYETIKVNSTFENVVEFRRALSHYAIINEFAFFSEKSEPTRVTARCSDLQCKWGIHASVMQDGISFEVKKLVEPHSCTRSNKGANKVATQGWVASVLRHKLKCDGDVSIKELHKWVKINFNVDLPYMKIFRGKEQAYSDLYGNWEDSFIKTNAFKEELLRRNPGSVAEVDIETKGNKKLMLSIESALGTYLVISRSVFVVIYSQEIYGELQRPIV
ncbi:putative transposase, MuDR, plant [Helianthus debilis subsp. tardiflorus]